MQNFTRVCVLAASLMVGVGSVSAQNVQEMLKAKNCLACHAQSKKLVGPSFDEIARVYEGKEVEKRLTQKVMQGTSGQWGPVPMPANPQVNEQEAQLLVRHILKR